MKPTTSTSRDSPYISPKLFTPSPTKNTIKSPKTLTNPTLLASFNYPHHHHQANPELNKLLIQSAHHSGTHHSRGDFLIPNFIKKVQEITITHTDNSPHLHKPESKIKQVQKSPKFIPLDQSTPINRTRKLSCNQLVLNSFSPKFQPIKTQLSTTVTTIDQQLPVNRDRKLSYQVSTQNIHAQVKQDKKQSHSFWPMSPNTQIRRQSDLLPGILSGRNHFLGNHLFHPKNNQNANSPTKLSSPTKLAHNDDGKCFFPSFKNKRLRKNSQSDNLMQKDPKNLQVPSFLLKKIHKQNQDVKPQQKAQYFKDDNKERQDLNQNSRNSSKQKKLSLKDFVMIRQLGQGKFGKVLLVRQKASGFTCAMKVFKKSQIQGDNFIDQFIREMKIQMFLNHPSVIKMYGYFDDLSFIYILLEVAIEGTLFSFLQNMNKKERCDNEIQVQRSGQNNKKKGLTGLSIKQTAVIMYQICTSVNYLHSNNIIHRDLKPQNVVMHEKTIKLCDFGWSVYKGRQMRRTFCGTPLYLCPELISGQEYDQKVDIWAIGIMLYQFLIGPNPFNICKESDLLNIVRQQIKIDKNDANIKEKGLDQTSIQLINGCLCKDRLQRLDIREIVGHEFFRKYCPQVMVGGGGGGGVGKGIVWEWGK